MGITLDARTSSQIATPVRVRQSAAMSSTADTIAALRKSYERAELSEDASHADPLKQFDQCITVAIAE